MCFIHKWNKWKKYEKPVPEQRISTNYALSAGVEHRQSKTCEKCGKTTDQYIGFTSS